MRLLRLALPALAFVAAGSWATHSSACDDKTSARTTAAHSSCSAKSTTASAASSSSTCGSKTSAAAYAASSNSSCAAKNTAVVAGSSSHCAQGAKTSMAVADGAASCEAHGKAKTTAFAAGSSCSGRGMTTSVAKSGHGDCDACADMALCYEELEAAGTRTQVVPLKNGVMFVYTAESPGHVNAVQTAMARRNERLSQIVTAGDKAHLCPECKTIRGAMASGKMTREVVNIEGGALTLMTSNDPTVVARIHAMVESHKGGRSKI